MAWLTYYFAMSPSYVARFAERGIHVDALISFAQFVKRDPDPIHRVTRWMRKEVKRRAMLDSGAFTNFQKPGTVLLEQYRDYLKSHAGEWTEYVTLDDLGSRDNTIKNYEVLRGHGLKPLFVDHVRYADDPRVQKIWEDEDKLCMGAWGTQIDATLRGKTPSVLNAFEQIPKKAELARRVKTKTHLLAVSSLIKFLPHLDVVDSVDSATWAREAGYGKLVAGLQKPIGGLAVPFMWIFSNPDSRINDAPMPPAVLERFKEHRADKRFQGQSRSFVIQSFCVKEILKYVDALNHFNVGDLVAAVVRERDAARKAEERTIFMPLDLDDDGFAPDAWGAKAAEPLETRSADPPALTEETPEALARVPDVALLELAGDVDGAVRKRGAPDRRQARLVKMLVDESNRRGLVIDGATLPGKLQACVARVAAHKAADADAPLLVEIVELADEQLTDKATRIQSLIFAKDKFQTADEAKAWAKAHQFRNDKVDETDESFRLRQAEPSEFEDGSFRTIDITDGVKAVIGTPKVAKTEGGCDNCAKCKGMCAAQRTVKIVKQSANDEQRIVLGIVAEPGEVDTEGDTINAETIERAAHRWLAKFQDRGLMHRKIVNGKIELYESWVALEDTTIGGGPVKKGSWLLVYHVLDDAIWKDIKEGRLTGLSLGGFARRVPTDAPGAST